jgi:hypothetical protein
MKKMQHLMKKIARGAGLTWLGLIRLALKPASIR